MGKIEDGEKHFKYMHALYKIVKKNATIFT